MTDMKRGTPDNELRITEKVSEHSQGLVADITSLLNYNTKLSYKRKCD